MMSPDTWLFPLVAPYRHLGFKVLEPAQPQAFHDHLSPELDAFVRLQVQGVPFEEAYAHCLADQGEEFTEACEAAKRSKPLVTHDNLAELTSISQKGFAREPRELLALAQWSDHVSGFLVSCERFH